ncbi:hypothetical protein EON66_09920, partial [archaeon]
IMVVCNLKPRTMVGFESQGMVLCASNADRSVVEFVDPPAGARIGERIAIEGLVSADMVAPEVINPAKKDNPWTPFAEVRVYTRAPRPYTARKHCVCHPCAPPALRALLRSLFVWCRACAQTMRASRRSTARRCPRLPARAWRPPLPTVPSANTCVLGHAARACAHAYRRLCVRCARVACVCARAGFCSCPPSWHT